MRSRNTRTLSIAAMTAGVLVAGLGTSTAQAAEPPQSDASAVGATAPQAVPAVSEAPASALGDVVTALGGLLSGLLAVPPPQAPAAPAGLSASAGLSAPPVVGAQEQLPLPEPPVPLPVPLPSDPGAPALPADPALPQVPGVPGLPQVPTDPGALPLPADPGALPLPLPSVPPLPGALPVPGAPALPALPLDVPGAAGAADAPAVGTDAPSGELATEPSDDADQEPAAEDPDLGALTDEPAGSDPTELDPATAPATAAQPTPGVITPAP